jgi:hypothetical protein
MKKKIELSDGVRALRELINGLNSYSLKDKTNVVLAWGESFPHQTPQSFLGEELYLNYLYYLLVNSIDNYIGNTKTFIPSQNYGQESTRICMPDKTNLTYLFEQHMGRHLGSINWTLWCALNHVDAEIRQTGWYNPHHDYRKEYNREFRNRDNNLFAEPYLKSLMNTDDYKNFLIYKELYLIDEKIGNCSSFVPSQDYNQEHIRQTKMLYLREGLEKNEAFLAFHDAIDTAVNTVLFADFEDPKPSEEDEDLDQDEPR